MKNICARSVKQKTYIYEVAEARRQAPLHGLGWRFKAKFWWSFRQNLLKHLEEKYEFKKYSKFVFTELMLDEFLDKKEEWTCIIIKTWRIMTLDGLLASF